MKGNENKIYFEQIFMMSVETIETCTPEMVVFKHRTPDLPPFSMILSSF